VEAGDSYWRIAERTLPAELGREPTGAEVLIRTHQLIAGNASRLGYDDPHLLHPGDVVYLTADPRTIAPVASNSDGYVVVADDSYWRIAEQTLPAELGRQPTDAEVLARTHKLIAGNASRLGYDDPDLLHPGDIVYLPRPSTAPPASGRPGPPVAPTPSPPAANPPPPATPAPPPAGGPPPAVLPPRPTPRTPVAEPADPPPAAAPDPGAPGPSPVPAATVRASAVSDSEPRPVPAAGLLAGLSTVALAGLAAAWTHRRRRASQQARPHQRPAPMGDGDRDVAAEVVYRDVFDVTWMAAELRWLAHQLPVSARSELTVQVVQIDAHGCLEVAFVEIPAGAPPAGWRVAAERVWRLERRHDDAELAAAVDAPPVLPALVTLGDPSAGQLFLNLEATTGINLSGDDAQVAAWLTNAVWELAGGALGERTSVVLVDVDVPGADQLDGVSRMSADEALAAVAANHDLDGTVAMLQRRVNDREAWPPTVVILDACNASDAWIEQASRPAVAVIAVNGTVAGGLGVELDAGELTIPAWRLRLPATVLDAATAEVALGVLQVADTAPVDDDLAVAVPSRHAAPVEAEGETADDWEPPSWTVMVHLLGEPFATRDGEPLALSPQCLSALAFLAVERDASVRAFDEAMWGDEDVPYHRRRDLLSSIRKATGGPTVVPHADDGRVRAGPDLGSDLAVFEALNNRAQHAPGELQTRLDEITQLVRGRPFVCAPSAAHLWRWADLSQLHALWGHRAATVAWELAGLYLERGDAGAARDVAERGLLADPLNAGLTERLMEAYVALDAVEAAQRVYESHDRALTSRGFEGAAEETRRLLDRLRAAHHGAVDAAVSS
jgi:DNA-binding SARP family transcriptional activator